MKLSAESITAIEIDMQTATVYVRGERGVLLWRRACASVSEALAVAGKVNAKWLKRLGGAR